MDDIDEAHQVDPVRQVDHKDARFPVDIGRSPVDIGRFPIGIGRFPLDIGRLWVDIGRCLACPPSRHRAGVAVGGGVVREYLRVRPTKIVRPKTKIVELQKLGAKQKKRGLKK